MPTSHLDTPCIVVDELIVDSNIEKFQKYCNSKGLLLRPHVKTHKIPEFAFRQLKAGATGINCQKISEAEVFAEAGIQDILITFNILGKQKLKRLLELSKTCKLSVVVDSQATAQQLSDYFSKAQAKLAVFVECDTGAARCGVQTPTMACQLAQLIDKLPAIQFAGLLTYPLPSNSLQANEWLRQAKKQCQAAGLKVPLISTGGTPSMFTAADYTQADEYRVGTYIYNDRSLIAHGTCTIEDCALSVLTTVVSRPTENRVIIDAGSKVLSSDLLGLQGYGLVKEFPDAVIYSLSEEHGCIDFSACTTKPDITDQLNIIPNHVCVVSNLFNFIHLKQKDNVIRQIEVTARGMVW